MYPLIFCMYPRYTIPLSLNNSQVVIFTHCLITLLLVRCHHSIPRKAHLFRSLLTLHRLFEKDPVGFHNDIFLTAICTHFKKKKYYYLAFGVTYKVEALGNCPTYPCYKRALSICHNVFSITFCRNFILVLFVRVCKSFDALTYSKILVLFFHKTMNGKEK